MNPERGVVFSEKIGSHLLLLHMVRCVVEKHGGSIKLDEKNKSMFLSIPENNKAACFKELEDTIGPSRPLNEGSASMQ
jgi:hypothetical protein